MLHGIVKSHISDAPGSLEDDQPPGSITIPSEKAALDFLTAAIIWFDILACVSTRTRPYLSAYHHVLLASKYTAHPIVKSPNIELHGVMGCQTWVMIVISDIAALDSSSQGTEMPANSSDMKFLSGLPPREII